MNIALIDYVGMDKLSMQVRSIMTSIFVISFINTAIILLLTNANLDYSVLSFIPLKNQYPDIDMNWYIEVGPSLVQTMLICAVYPPLEFFGFYGILALTRYMDSGWYCCRREKKTKKVTQQQYVNLYGGPTYAIHFKYSSIMVQVFVSFFYGLFLPVLFPICLFGLINMYVTERMCMAYYYKQPPMYDEKLNKRAIGLLKVAPCFMFFLGYWALGNRQIFFNEANEVKHGNQVADPGHELIYFEELIEFNHVALMLFAFIGSVVLYFLSDILVAFFEHYEFFSFA